MTAAQTLGAILVSLPFIVMFYAMAKDLGLAGAVWVFATTLATCAIIVAGVALLCA